ncbi:hypothetical protein F511_34374 [Dorcoceras hygrometricum]|uniref:Zinc finger, CCHC-type, retrotransposon Gag domain protein n=1 Tax=Dorcoceras hygrometricum TaxID=472368 RepID=A0A2Z7C384_9LAMI|nr:hypothetical protein F511_34374 [Dorcoceras hygrometricum]
MPPRRDRTQQDDATPPPPPPPPQLTPYERASVDMLAGITKLLERHSERPGKSHEEDVAERFRKQGPKEFAGTTDPLVAEEWIRSMETIYDYMGLANADCQASCSYQSKNTQTHAEAIKKWVKFSLLA